MSKRVLRSDARNRHNRRILQESVKARSAAPKIVNIQESDRKYGSVTGFLEYFCKKYTEFQRRHRGRLFLQFFEHFKVYRFFTLDDDSGTMWAYKIERIGGDFIVSQYRVIEDEKVEAKMLDNYMMMSRRRRELKKRIIESSAKLFDPRTYKNNEKDAGKEARQREILDLTVSLSQERFKNLKSFAQIARGDRNFGDIEVSANKVCVALPNKNTTCALRCRTCGQLDPSSIHSGQETKPMSLDDDDDDDEGSPSDGSQIETFQEERLDREKVQWAEDIFAEEGRLWDELNQTLLRQGVDLETIASLNVPPFKISTIRGADKSVCFYEIKKEDKENENQICLRLPTKKGVREKIRIKFCYRELNIFRWQKSERSFHLHQWNYQVDGWDLLRLGSPRRDILDYIRYACVSFDKKIYILGGILRKIDPRVWTPSKSIFSFDESSKQFSPCDVELDTATSSSAAVVLDRALLVTGGETIESSNVDDEAGLRGQILGNVQIFYFDFNSKGLILSKSRYSKTTTLETPRRDHACVVWKNKAYVVGGSSRGNENEEKYLDSLEVIEKSRGYYFVKPLEKKMKTARKNFAAVVLHDKLYIMGGYHKGMMLNSVECYDLNKEKWETVAALKSRRGSCCATVWEGRIFVFGGFEYEDKENEKKKDDQLVGSHNRVIPNDTVESFDPEDGAWVEERSYRHEFLNFRLTPSSSIHYVRPDFAALL